MSYDIEYHLRLFVDNTGDPPRYLLIQRVGPSNGWETHRHLRVKSWEWIAAGSATTIWRALGRLAGATEGGLLQKAQNWTQTTWWTPETYIAHARKVWRQARPLSTFWDTFALTCDLFTVSPFPTSPPADLAPLADLLPHLTLLSTPADAPYPAHYFGAIPDLSTLQSLLTVPRRVPGLVQMTYHLTRKESAL